MKKTHLLAKPTRLQAAYFDDLDELTESRSVQRAAKSRLRSYRKLRHQDF